MVAWMLTCSWIAYRDLSAMTDFYQTALGFAVHSRFPETEPTLVFLTIANLDSPLGRGGQCSMKRKLATSGTLNL